MTGFRVSRGGWAGLEPVDADLYTYGKVMGGGLPAAAFGGRAEIMGQLAPAGPVYQAGTLSGNPLACAAGLATLRACTDEVYARLDKTAATVGELATAALTEAGVPHRRQSAGNMFSIFFTDADGHRLRDGEDPGRRRVPGVLPRDAGPRGVPAAVVVRGVVRLGRHRRRRARGHRGRPATRGAGRRQGCPWVKRSSTCSATVRCTTPPRSCTAGCPASGCPPLGEQMAKAAAAAVADRDIRLVVSSPLERAVQTAEPIAAQFGLPIETDDRLIESANFFEGKRVGVGDGALRDPRNWWVLRDPFRPSWGESYVDIAHRMYGALQAARAQAEGHEALLVSHQLPIWTLRRHLERQRLWHDPRRRQCGLASLTSFHFDGGDADRHRVPRAGGRTWWRARATPARPRAPDAPAAPAR